MKELLKVEIKMVSGCGLSWLFGIGQLAVGAGLTALGVAGMFPLLAEGNIDYIIERKGVIDNVRYERGVRIYETHDEKYEYKANKPYLSYSPALANVALNMGIGLIGGGVVSLITSIIFKN